MTFHYFLQVQIARLCLKIVVFNRQRFLPSAQDSQNFVVLSTSQPITFVMVTPKQIFIVCIKHFYPTIFNDAFLFSSLIEDKQPAG